MLLFVILPLESMIRQTPIGFVLDVAVHTVTSSLKAQRDERASPRKPNVQTEVRSEKDASLEVWCFRAGSISAPSEEFDASCNHTYTAMIFFCDSRAIIHNFYSFQAVLLEAYF